MIQVGETRQYAGLRYRIVCLGDLCLCDVLASESQGGNVVWFKKSVATLHRGFLERLPKVSEGVTV